MTAAIWLTLAGVMCAVPMPSRARVRLRALPGAAFGAGAASGARAPSRAEIMGGPVLAGLASFRRDGRSATSGRRRGERTIGAHRGAWTASVRDRRALAGLSALVAGAVATVGSGQVLVGAAAAGVAATAVGTVASRVRRSEAATARRDLRAALSMVDAELSAGAREQDALGAVALIGGRPGPVFGRAAVAAGHGGDVGSVFAAGGPGYSSLAAAWSMRSMCGAPLAEIVAKVELDLAGADAHDRRLDAALAGPRSSAAMLSVLPALGVLLGSAMGAHPLHLLLGTDRGSALLLAGVLLDLLGLAWTRRLIRAGGGS